ncbi:putative membrane protein [Crocosphaera subtropica ATCC 51142]|uniref:Membrane protein n=1 Tax=Crocosphaera subtropica (strain ATCC 51142 / BH68) TaxID=43989 RepID=B1WWQ4_CROS5|nr:membrane protein [Crocosphaera subtropica]ACB50778.1 putative membrane protein [Crocosphaera subtropica ATCC 51142]
MKLETILDKIKPKGAGLSRQLSLRPYLLEGIIVALLIIATIIINYKMIKDGINGKVDLKWHLTWIQHFSKQLSEGIWYPRWLAGTNYGYGSPTFVFYPPFVYYLGSFLKLTGLNTQDVVITLFSLALFLSGFTFYLYGRTQWGRTAALLGGFAYMTVPYIAFDIYWRGGLASVFVQAWIPLLWWSTDQSLSEKKWRFTLPMSWTLIALTHTPSLLVCAIGWFPYVLFSLLNRPWKAVVKTIVSAGIGWGMASFYLLPAILEKRFVNIEVMRGIWGGAAANLLNFRDIFTNIHQDQIVYIFSHQALVILILIIIACFIHRYQSDIIQKIQPWLVFILALVFIMSSFSELIWDMSPTLQMLQFPWRFLQIFSFVGAVLFTIVVNGILTLPLSPRFLLSTIIIGLLFFNFSYSYKVSRKYVTLRNPGRGSIEHLSHIVTILEDPYTNKLRDVEEYRPLIEEEPSSPPVPLQGQPKLSVMSGEANIEIEQWKSYHRVFSVRVEKSSKLRIRLYYYPAWHLYINQKSSPITMSKDGTIELQLDPGFYNVELRYQWTLAFTIGVIVSFLSFATLIFLNRNVGRNLHVLNQESI